jgi:hypothetical protein
VSIQLIPNENQPALANLLRKVCDNDAALSVDIGTANDGTDDSGNPVVVSNPGYVTYAPDSTASSTCQMVGALANNPSFKVSIAMVAPSFKMSDGTHVGTHGAATQLHTYLILFHNSNAIEIYLDATNNNGLGYWVQAMDGDHIDGPMDTFLAHELGHAFNYTLTPPTGGNESAALELENNYRRAHGMPERYTLANNGGPKAAAANNDPNNPQPPNSSDQETGHPQSFGPINCTIAQATYQSPLATMYLALRSFRDEVLRKTRPGSQLYDSLYGSYAQINPGMLELMESDPKVREMIRTGLTPMLHYLDGFVAFPAEPLDGVPEPWRSYLAKTAANFEEFARVIEPPVSFCGQTAAAAVAEISMVLRYCFRSRDKREQYLERLVAAGSLPLAVTGPQERVALRRQLWAGAVDLDPGERVLPRLLGPAAIMGSIGPNESVEADPLFLYILITNQSGSAWGDVALSYQLANMPFPVLDSEGPLIPSGKGVWYCLGDPAQVVSFAFDVFDTNDNVIPDYSLGSVTLSDPSLPQYLVSQNFLEFDCLAGGGIS